MFSFLKNLKLKLGQSTIVLVAYLTAVTVLGLYGEGTIAAIAMSILMFFGVYVAIGLARNLWDK